MTSFPNQERVIREVGKAYDLVKELHALLQFKSTRKLEEDKICINELAQPLFKEALQGLNVSLQMMKPDMLKMETKLEILGAESCALVCGSQDSALSNDFDQRSAKRRQENKVIKLAIHTQLTREDQHGQNNLWTSTTTMPYDDGYQWRKYGEKKSSGTNFSRCTFKEEQGCLAKKIVQQTTKRDPPLFQVKYTEKHTCNAQRSIPPLVLEQNVYQQNYQRNNYITPHMYPDLADDGLKETLSSHYTVERPGEWDDGSLIMELVGFDPSDANLLLS